MVSKTNWELRALMLKAGYKSGWARSKKKAKTEFAKKHHVCWFEGKKHCRICGESELDVFLNLFGNGIAEYSHE